MELINRRLKDKITTHNMWVVGYFLELNGFTLQNIGGGGGGSSYWIEEIYQHTNMEAFEPLSEKAAVFILYGEEREIHTIGEAVEFFKEKLKIGG